MVETEQEPEPEQLPQAPAQERTNQPPLPNNTREQVPEEEDTTTEQN